jgi:hypothetical protein
MQTYEVDVIATVKVRNIQATTKEEAEEIAQEMLANGEVVEGDSEYDFIAKEQK